MVLYMPGCGGSTFAYHFLLHLFGTANMAYQKNDKELSKASRAEAMMKRYDWEYKSVFDSLRRLHEDAVDKGEVMAMVAQAGHAWEPGVAEYFAANASIVVVHRNTLDWGICTTRDCMAPAMWPKEVNTAVPVFENGTRSNLCFARRGKNWVSSHPTAVPDDKVLVDFQDPDALREYLETHSLREQLENDVLVRGLRIRASLVYEELAAFQYEETPTLATTRSVSAWWRLVDAFGAEIDEETIRRAMATWLDEMGLRPRQTYRDTIYNYDDVKDIVDALGYHHLEGTFQEH